MANFNSTNRSNFQDMLNASPELVEERRLKMQRGCRRVIAAFVLLTAALVLFFGCPELIYPNKIKGKTVDVIFVPGKNNKDGYLWILTDGSYVYTSKKQSGINKDIYFSKKFIHIYDPIAKKVISRFNVKYTANGYLIKLVYQKNSVTLIIPQDADNKQRPEIVKFNAENGKVIARTEDFMKRFPIISSGISELFYSKDPESISITALDGQKGSYYFDCDTIFLNIIDYRNYKIMEQDTTKITINMLAADNNAPQRKELYQVWGPKNVLLRGNISETYIKDSSTLYFFCHSFAKPLLPGKIFIEGYILFSDNDYVVVLHQKQTGNESDRMLTCVSTNGKYMWTMEQSQLFDNLRLSAADAFSTLFFIKSDLYAERYGDILCFKYKNNQIMGINIHKGEKIWTYIK